jgi:lambda family phage minor tail protein L
MSESTNLNLQGNVQSLNPSPSIELYSLDTSPITAVNGVPGTGAVYNWTPGNIGAAPLFFGGVSYSPLPIEFTDMKTSGQGTVAAPVISISSLGGLVGALVASFADLVGAKVTRIRTFANCLDGAVDADPTAFIGPDIFYVDRKSHHDKNYVEFTLAISYDQQGKVFPGRQVLSDACTRTYRFWNVATSAFIQGTCPYTGANYFDTSGNSTTDPTQDFCSKQLNSGCLLRFQNDSLPTYAFPGASLTGIG